MLLNELFAETPRMINGYERIIISQLKVEANLKKMRFYFEGVPKGSLEEVLISYDNIEFRYSLRVSGRGRKIGIVGEKYKMFSDYVGQIAAEEIETKKFNTKDVAKIMNEFLDWTKAKN